MTARTLIRKTIDREITKELIDTIIKVVYEKGSNQAGLPDRQAGRK
jgi:hypothetical protein